MMNPCRSIFLMLMLMLLSVSVQAATYPVDDRGTNVHQPIVRTKWLSNVPTRHANSAITGVVVVDVQLDTSDWKGKPGKIYMLLAPASASGPIKRAGRRKAKSCCQEIWNLDSVFLSMMARLNRINYAIR